MEKNKKNVFKLLALQFSSKIANKKANYKTVLQLVEENIDNSVDFLFLPEVWTVGWKCDEFINSAEKIENSETVKFLSDIAKKYDVNIIGGSFISQKGEKFYNTCPVINRKGELITTYDKMHLFSYYGCDEGTYVKNGSNPVLVEIEGLRIGLSICYDIRFPEIYRSYAKQGVDLLVNMAAWPLGREIHWKSLTTARAVENQSYFVALTQSGKLNDNEYNLGYSKIIDYDGKILAETNELRSGICATIDLEPMREFRQKCRVLEDICEVYDVKKYN